jgi:hypothetical protein
MAVIGLTRRREDAKDGLPDMVFLVRVVDLSGVIWPAGLLLASREGAKTRRMVRLMWSFLFALSIFRV